MISIKLVCEKEQITNPMLSEIQINITFISAQEKEREDEKMARMMIVIYLIQNYSTKTLLRSENKNVKFFDKISWTMPDISSQGTLLFSIWLKRVTFRWLISNKSQTKQKKRKFFTTCNQKLCVCCCAYVDNDINWIAIVTTKPFITPPGTSNWNSIYKFIITCKLICVD